MAGRKKYQLIYPDGGKKHIDREERDNLLMTARAKQIAPGKFLYTGMVSTYHQMSDLRNLEIQMPATAKLQHHLPGTFRVESDARNVGYVETLDRHIPAAYIEQLETPEGMTERLIRTHQV